MNNLNFIAEKAYRFKIVLEREDGSFHAYYFDAQRRENVFENVNITSHPTTIGRNITDNAYPEPITLSASVRVAYVESRKRPQGENFTWFGDRKAAIDALEELRLNNNVCTIYTRHTMYENMVLKSVNKSNEGRNQLNLDIDLEFQEIRFNEYQDYEVTEEDISYGVDGDTIPDGSIEEEADGAGVGETAARTAGTGATLGLIGGAVLGAKKGAKAGAIGGIKGAAAGAIVGGIVGVTIGIFGN